MGLSIAAWKSCEVMKSGNPELCVSKCWMVMACQAAGQSAQILANVVLHVEFALRLQHKRCQRCELLGQAADRESASAAYWESSDRDQPARSPCSKGFARQRATSTAPLSKSFAAIFCSSASISPPRSSEPGVGVVGTDDGVSLAVGAMVVVAGGVGLAGGMVGMGVALLPCTRPAPGRA